jgi:hypothetical protein
MLLNIGLMKLRNLFMKYYKKVFDMRFKHDITINTKGREHFQEPHQFSKLPFVWCGS